MKGKNVKKITQNHLIYIFLTTIPSFFLSSKCYKKINEEEKNKDKEKSLFNTKIEGDKVTLISVDSSLKNKEEIEMFGFANCSSITNIDLGKVKKNRKQSFFRMLFFNKYRFKKYRIYS